jgi:hypothetical protein
MPHFRAESVRETRSPFPEPLPKNSFRRTIIARRLEAGGEVAS